MKTTRPGTNHRIINKLADHADRMAKYELAGVPREEASRRALDDMKAGLATVVLKIRHDSQNCVTTRNDVGGTEYLPKGDYFVVVLRKWYDYECGYRYAGRLIGADSIARVAEVARTPYEPKAADVDLAAPMAYFSEDAIVGL